MSIDYSRYPGLHTELSPEDKSLIALIERERTKEMRKALDRLTEINSIVMDVPQKHQRKHRKTREPERPRPWFRKNERW